MIRSAKTATADRVRAVHLKPGDLITLTYLKEGFLREPFRVLKIAAGLK